MKKFLKGFGLLALVFCCIFSFVGCSFFDSENEYDNLIADKKIIREVVSNSKKLIQSHLENEPGTSAFPADISIKSGYDWVNSAMKTSKGLINAIETIINDSDFVPGMLRTLVVEDIIDGDTTYSYVMLNAFCDDDNVVTLNMFILNSDTGNVFNFSDYVATSINLHYNNDNMPVKLIVADGGFAHAEFQEIQFSATGEFESYHRAFKYVNYDENGVANGEERRITDVDKNGDVTDLSEQDADTSVFSSEIRAIFNAEIKFVEEKNKFGSPLSKEVADKFIENMQNSETE